MRYLMTFSYDGTNFNGYQVQPNLRTVQECLENAVSYLNKFRYDKRIRNWIDMNIEIVIL